MLVLGHPAVVGVHAAPTDAERPRHEGVRDCRSRGEIGRPIEFGQTRNDLRIGPLVLANVRRATASPTRRSDWPLLTKVPLTVRAGARVVLAVAPEARTRAAFQHRGDWVSAVRFVACHERVRAWSYRGTVGETTFFPFGVALQQRSACVPMELWIDSRASPLRRVVPVGRRRC